jgi:uncharacterized surface protein with fasciclin (FAS1) repeats
MIRMLTAAAAAAALAIALPATASATKAPQKTIADVLLADKAGDNAQGFDRNWYDYDIVTEAVLLFPELVADAQNPAASLTGFIPNDRAFQVLVKDLTGSWPRNEADTFAAVASLGLPTVKTVLTYHLVGAKISARDALRSNGAELETLQGGKLTVRVPFRWLPFVTLKDQDPTDRNPFVVQFNVGGALANGYLHGISLGLRPSDL